MKKLIYMLLISLAIASVATAQTSTTNATTSGSTDSTVTGNVAGRSVQLASGTQIAAQLQNTLDVRKAKVGDQVLFKTRKALKSDGQTLVDKGARLIGHVTGVAQRSKNRDGSHITILFDRIENGSLSMPIVATITSIMRSNVDARSSDDAFLQSSANSNAQRNTSIGAQGSGLIGGVANTAGDVVGGTVSTIGSTVGTTTGAVGSTVDNTTTSASSLTRKLSRVQISHSTATSAQGGSTLSLQSDDLRLEKGTHFNLVLNEAANATVNKQP
jgi:hypothetical protein